MLTSDLLGWRGRIGATRVLRAIDHWQPSTLAGVSVAEWVEGMHLTADAADLVLALIRVSSYGHAPEVMSADLAAAQIQMALGGGVRYLDGGWQTMVDALAARLDVRRLQAVAVQDDGGRVVVTTAGGPAIVGATAVVATGTPTGRGGTARPGAVRVRAGDRGVVPRPRRPPCGAATVPARCRPAAVPVHPPPAGAARAAGAPGGLADALPRPG